MQRKGQAAMEFLMTYGWAILAAVIVIGVLAYFGVFSPSSYVPNQCILSAPLGCNAGVANSDGVELEIRNGAGEGLIVSAITVTGCSGTVSPALPATVADGSLTAFTVPCTLTAGSKFTGDVTVSYTKSGSTLELTSTGKITDKV